MQALLINSSILPAAEFAHVTSGHIGFLIQKEDFA